MEDYYYPNVFSNEIKAASPANAARSGGVVHQISKREPALTKSSSDLLRRRLSAEQLKDAIKKYTTGRERKINVRAIRESLDLSQDKFAEAYNFAPKTIKNWEQGISEPGETSQMMLMAIAIRPDEMRLVAQLLKAKM